MEFWRGNKVDAGFEMPVREVADQFIAWAKTEGVEADMLQGLPIERTLRWWLCSSEHFNSVWVAETGPESFAALFDRIADLIYGRVIVAEIDRSQPPAWSEPDNSVNHG
jgi:hypothetical protein